MFGNLLFGYLPFSVHDTATVPVSWVDVCADKSDWEDQEVNVLATRKCSNGL